MSKVTPIFLAEVKESRLILQKPDIFRSYLSHFKKGIVEVIVRTISKDRSDRQNRYYWGAVLPIISSDTGFTKEELHQIFRNKFLRYGKTYKGRNYNFSRSTTDLTTIEFEEYLDKIRIFSAAELGIVVPLPNEISF